MNKRTLISILALILCMLCLLSGCNDGKRSASGNGSFHNSPDPVATEMANLRAVDGKDYLVYDVDTSIVYYMFSTFQYAGYGYGYFGPYLSKNGLPCQYVNGEIVEIAN